MSPVTDKANSSPATLDGLQAWLQNAITTPQQTDQNSVPDVIAGGKGKLTPFDRLGIYTRSYQGRLVECMESEFPVLRLALGPPLFARFASEYLVSNPSRSYTLAKLGENFPRYLRDTRPPDEDELWPEFLIELALLERTFGEVYRGDGPEGSSVNTGDDVDSLLAAPGTCWMRCNFPVDEYFTASRQLLKDEEEPEPPDFPSPEPVFLILYRRDYVVRLRRVTEESLPPGGEQRDVNQ